MFFHNELAALAVRDGNTSQQFRAAAQKHANATWFFLIVAGAVWYFSSWMWSLIPFALATFVTIKSITATAVAIKLEKSENPSS